MTLDEKSDSLNVGKQWFNEVRDRIQEGTSPVKTSEVVSQGPVSGTSVRNKERGDIREYGADKTSNDNTKAIQDALDDAGLAYIPPGTWDFDGKVSTTDSLAVITGDGPNSELNYTGSGVAIDFRSTAGRLTGFKLNGPGGSSGATGISVGKVNGFARHNMNLDHLLVSQFNVGFKTERLFSFNLTDSRFVNAPVQLLDNGTNAYLENNWFSEAPKDEWAVRCEGYGRLGIDNCNFDAKATGGNGLLLLNTNTWSIRQCNFEEFYTSGSSGSPDRDGLQLGGAKLDGSSAFWGNGEIQGINLKDLQNGIVVENTALSDATTVEVTGVRETNVSQLVDVPATSKTGRLLSPDETLLRSDVANDPITVCEFPVRRSAGPTQLIVQEATTTINAGQCVQVSGWDTSNVGSGIPMVRESLANNTSLLEPFAVLPEKADFGEPTLAVTEGPVSTGKDQSSWTAGNAAYLQDDGTIGNTAGTNTVQVGWVLNTDNPGEVYFQAPGI